MRFLKYFLVIGWILPTDTLRCQLNESDTAGLQLRAGISGNWQKGNVDLLVLRSRLEAVTNGRNPLVFKTQNNWLYQAFAGRKADNDISSRNYIYFNPTKKVYPFAMIYLQSNYRRNISTRWFGGAGGSWQFVRNAKSNIKLSGSLVYEQTIFKGNEYNEIAYNGSDQIRLWRATTYLAGWHQISKQRVRVYYIAYWQPGLSNIHNFRSQIDAGIDFPLWKGFNASVGYSLTHDEVVQLQVKQTDRIVTFGFSYVYKK